jgi:hypothetical protein
MQITVKRLHKTDTSTIGELLIDGVFECYTLEDVERPVKIKAETAIPKGTYKVIINQSNNIEKMAALAMANESFNPYNLRDGEMSSGVFIML